MSNDKVVTAQFDRECRHWSTAEAVNDLFLKTINNYMNDRLRMRGHVFVNEVFDELSIPRTSQGQLTGWLLSNGDTIEFETEKVGDEGAILITLTHDGIIYEQIEGES